jgi:hypothetical protein
VASVRYLASDFWRAYVRETSHRQSRLRQIEFATDSPLEEAGFEPSLPLKAPGALVVSVLVRADFSVGGNQTEAT